MERSSQDDSSYACKSTRCVMPDLFLEVPTTWQNDQSASYKVPDPFAARPPVSSDTQTQTSFRRTGLVNAPLMGPYSQSAYTVRSTSVHRSADAQIQSQMSFGKTGLVNAPSMGPCLQPTYTASSTSFHPSAVGLPFGSDMSFDNTGLFNTPLMGPCLPPAYTVPSTEHIMVSLTESDSRQPISDC